jgi:hypothetical protein
VNGTARFKLGEVVASPGALRAFRLNGIRPAQLLARHVTGDWGELDDEDMAANEKAVENGSRIKSSYGEGPDAIWVITEADRRSTCILLPVEYSYGGGTPAPNDGGFSGNS